MIARTLKPLMLTVCAFLSVPLAAQDSSGPIVNIASGKLQGSSLPSPGGAVFKGIPYAAPPLGELRWAEPQPVKPWLGIRSATAYGADCPAIEGYADKTRASSEDCLFLNVWTAEWPVTSSKPVIVWIHGGQFFGSQGTLPNGPAPDAAASLARHGVILVSINYRPLLQGLFAHPELTRGSPHHASGNYALLDAIAALHWVHDNIARFGGDPANVTAFGESDGAHITSFLVTSPLAKGLIQRAIIDSGAPVQSSRAVLSLHEMERLGMLAAEQLKAPANDPIPFLRSVPASAIAAESVKLRSTPGGSYDEGIDGYAIRESPAEMFRQHTEAHIPLLLGSTAQDSSSIDGVRPLAAQASQEETRAWLEGALQTFYGRYPDLLGRSRAIYGLHGEPNELSTNPAYGPVAEQLGVDLHHRCAVITTALWHSTVSPTYVFELSRAVPAHGAELQFVFGYLSAAGIADQSAHMLSTTMQRYWVNFAKTGDPNGPDLPAWPRYEAGTQAAIDFSDDGPVRRDHYRTAACLPYVDLMTRLPAPLFVK